MTDEVIPTFEFAGRTSGYAGSWTRFYVCKRCGGVVAQSVKPPMRHGGESTERYDGRLPHVEICPAHSGETQGATMTYDPEGSRQIRTDLNEAPVVEHLVRCEATSEVVKWGDDGHLVTDPSTVSWYPCPAVHRPLRVDVWSTRTVHSGDRQETP